MTATPDKSAQKVNNITGGGLISSLLFAVTIKNIANIFSGHPMRYPVSPDGNIPVNSSGTLRYEPIRQTDRAKH